MQDFENRNSEFVDLLAKSNRKMAMILAALDGKSKLVVKRNLKLKKQLQT